MKWIATYNRNEVDPVDAAEAHENEYYRRPHGQINGCSLGQFVETPEGVREYRADEGVCAIHNEWLERAAGDLFAHLKANTELGLFEGINSFSSGNSFSEEVLRNEKNWSFLLTIGAGYTAYISQDGQRVLAEAYVACSGNAVVVIHREDESVLYVNSARHGIPGLALPYASLEPLEVVMYDSLRTDVGWHVSGLKHPDEQDQEEDGDRYEDLADEMDAKYS